MTLMVLALAACDDGKESGADDSGTGPTDDTGTPDTCTAAVLASTPESGTADWYYRGILGVDFSGDGGSAVIEVADATGPVGLSEITWSEGNVQVFFRADLDPLTDYTLSVDVCGVPWAATFSTSELGSPLTDDTGDTGDTGASGNASLTGKTYVMRLSEATITEPGGIGPIVGDYLTVPLLFQVTSADETTIDFLGALGYQENDGSFAQICPEILAPDCVIALPTWDFPAGDFTDSPYFYAEAEYITIMYGITAIPIENFTLEGTFASDGTQILEARATGNADSRYMGDLLNQPENPAAVCELAATLGIYCEPCADGEPYCLYMVAEDIEADYEVGLTLVEVPS